MSLLKRLFGLGRDDDTPRDSILESDIVDIHVVISIDPNADESDDETDYEASPSTVFSSAGRGNGLVCKFSLCLSWFRIGVLAGVELSRCLVTYPFCSPATTTALGRYGPFRKADRKPKESIFDIKSFLFSHVPSEWAFGVQEKLFGRDDQSIDITDDRTGETHDIAKSHIPMYVNEVGHDKTLVQNIEALERHDRSIHYYINIRKPMEKGETVELLTNYLESKYFVAICSSTRKILH